MSNLAKEFDKADAKINICMPKLSGHFVSAWFQFGDVSMHSLERKHTLQVRIPSVVKTDFGM